MVLTEQQKYDILKQGKPVLMKTSSRSGGIFQVWQVTEDGIFYSNCQSVEDMNFKLFNYVEFHEETVKILSKWIFVDWFDNNEAVSNNGVCQCNIISLMQSGCSCGAISRYVPPSLG
jgi:hypothetical protein